MRALCAAFFMVHYLLVILGRFAVFFNVYIHLIRTSAFWLKIVLPDPITGNKFIKSHFGIFWGQF